MASTFARLGGVSRVFTASVSTALATATFSFTDPVAAAGSASGVSEFATTARADASCDDAVDAINAEETDSSTG
jgi:hypothetical protein